MLALTIVILSALVLFVIAPLLAVKKYYKLSNHSFFMNLIWIVVGIITWPLLPLILAVKHKAGRIITLFWVSFITWMLASAYWLATNQELLQQIQQAQEQLLI